MRARNSPLPLLSWWKNTLLQRTTAKRRANYDFGEVAPCTPHPLFPSEFKNLRHGCTQLNYPIVNKGCNLRPTTHALLSLNIDWFTCFILFIFGFHCISEQNKLDKHHSIIFSAQKCHQSSALKILVKFILFISTYDEKLLIKKWTVIRHCDQYVLFYCWTPEATHL